MKRGLRLLVALLVGATVLLAFVRPRSPRVLLVGDSLTHSFAPRATALLERDGYKVNQRSWPGLGLLDHSLDEPRTIVEAIVERLDEDDPDIVVAEFAGNYAVFSDPGPDLPQSRADPAFYADWDAAARQLTDQVVRRHATMLWALNPPMRTEPFASVSPRLNDIYRLLAANPAYGGRVRTASSDQAFGGNRFLPQYRDRDGVHLNAAGQDLFARVVHDAVLAQGPRPWWLLGKRRLALRLALGVAVLLAILLWAARHRRRRREALGYSMGTTG